MASGASNPQQITMQEELVTLYWLFFDKSHPDVLEPRLIEIPRPHLNKAVESLEHLFTAKLREKFGFVARKSSIRFWKPKELLMLDVAGQPEWAENAVIEHSFQMIRLTQSLSQTLGQEIENREIVHLVVTAKGIYQEDELATEEQDSPPNKKQRLVVHNDDIINKWQSRRLKSAIPSLADLRGVLAEPLTNAEKIPINESTYISFLSSTIGPDNCSEDIIDRLFKIGEPPEQLYQFILTVSNPPPTGGTEDSWHHFWDNNIRVPLELLLPTGKAIRNSNCHTETQNLHPDFGFLLENICPFRGEEKGPENLGDPRAELVDKINWVYDPAPYVLGYYCNGSRMTLAALTSPMGPQGSKPGLHDLVTLDLKQRKDRITNICHLINLSTILPHLSELVKSPVDDFEVFESTNSKVEITSTLIVKTYTCANAEAKVEHLQRIYAVLANQSVPNTDMLVFSNKNIVHLSPRGSPWHPRLEKELRECLVCVLQSLMVIHEIPLYHRDIRWGNIIRAINDHSKWFIIDWEDAATPPTKAAVSFSPSGHSPAIFHDGHGAEVDIWGIGHLITTCNAADMSMELKALGQHICRESQHLSAQEVHRLITTCP